MNTIYCHFSRPNEAEKEAFQAADRTSNQRKFTGDKLWITEVRTYIRVQPCCPVCALCETEGDGIRMPYPPCIAAR